MRRCSKASSFASLQPCRGIFITNHRSNALQGRNLITEGTIKHFSSQGSGRSIKGISLFVPATTTSVSLPRCGRNGFTLFRKRGRLFSTSCNNNKKAIVSLTTGGFALSAVTGRGVLKSLLPRIHCQDKPHPFDMDRFFQFSEIQVNSRALADAVARSRSSYSWCAVLANWGKYLFGLGLALVGGFGLWYVSSFQRQMADRLWPAFVFGALPMLVVGYLGRVGAAFLFMGAAGYGYYATMNYWEAEIVSNSSFPLTSLLADRADVKELVGDWGNNVKPHLVETYEVTTTLLHFSTEPKGDENSDRAANGFVFVLSGSHGQALVRVLTELNFQDRAQYHEQVREFFEQVDNYSYNILSFLQPFSRTPGPYPSIPEFQMKGVDLQYVDIVCVSGPKSGERIVLVDNMHKFSEVKQFLEIHDYRGDSSESKE